MDVVRSEALQPNPGTSTLELLIKEFHADDRPWVVAYSGGKDSTLVLQLVYEAMLQLENGFKKPIFVISSDTRVEAPNISRYVEHTLKLVESNAQARGLPLKVRLVKPTAEESFWGKLVGKGYPSPTRWFRWCTSNMKIKPSRRAIDEITRQYGSVVLLLGTRWDESDSRRTRMQARKSNDRQLNPHHEIPDALVMTPIADWSTDEVWEYLFIHNPPPWGGNHDYMLSLYRQASGGECPVVLDLNTPSCGGSRFGCWTCTVVKQDKSMQGFIEAGETWMKPLSEFRNWLKEIREDPRYRSSMRRDNTSGPGPFTPEARKIILERLLEKEQEVGFELISDQDLAYIQTQWTMEFDFSQTVYQLAKRYGREVKMSKTNASTPTEEDLLERLAVENGVHPDLPKELLRLVRHEFPSLDKYGAKSGLQKAVGDLIDKAVKQAYKADPADAL